jgi:ADP-ribose pyrophosphatase YjhB (NUDIX family)
MKPHKRAIALVIKDTNDNFLVVKRPDNADDDLAGVWGFPAVTLRDDESETDGANRVAEQKLGVKIEVGKRLGESTHERPNYVLTLCDYEAIVSDGVPTVPQPDTSVTQYAECKYTNDPSILFAAARKGSQCSQIFLETIGSDWRE